MVIARNSAFSVVQSNARIAALYAQGLVDYLRDRGLDTDGLRETADHPSGAAPGEASLSAWVTLLERSARQLGEPALPAVAGASLQPRHLGPLGHVLMSCDTLEDAYRHLARYIRLLGQIGQPKLVIKGEQAQLQWHWPYASAPPQSVALFMLAARVRFMRWLTADPNLVVDARIHGDAPGPIDAFREIFGGSVRFGGARSELVFPSTTLQKPVAMADAAFRKHAEQRAADLLEDLTGHPPLLRQIKHALLQRMASGEVALDDVARELHMSPRTLQRRLKGLDTSFHGVLESVRSNSALQLVTQGQTPLAEVAFVLGYSDQSTFNSAYKRWHGTSPGRARRAAQT